ncbi:CGH_1_HP_G0064600.mRNA.1.CDS.1 [Saccharomyces cerevisiae]|nr:CGH_1_HP_G0064600.mRNA.1.CDS.1 [Saccharomyces cerevisiae]CAI6851375.1 CGH_1_HP_G0064600.mRNA.1.CDS.1 [Saccharomyces cerevisiae]
MAHKKSFYQDDQVLYVSLHRFEMGKYYPGTIQGQYDQTGEGKGEGFNCNITWPVGGVGDAEYMWAFEQVVMPMGRIQA